MTLAMMEVISELGGTPFEDIAADEPGQRLNFGPLEAEAVVRVGRFLHECVMLSCTVNGRRTMSLLETELPCQVNSREQGVALLSYFLRDHIPKAMQPDWLRTSDQLAEYLPWNKKS